MTISPENVRITYIENLPGHEPTFSALTDCPSCKTVAVHYLDEPSKREPEVVETVITRNWTGQIFRETDVYDHHDERGWSVARTCIKCNHRWGQS